MATHPDMDKWIKLAEKELRGASLDTLRRTTPEDIIIKPLYTSADIADLDFVDTLPGFEPFVRGIRISRGGYVIAAVLCHVTRRLQAVRRQLRGRSDSPAGMIPDLARRR